MNTALTVQDDSKLIDVLRSSLYPNAAPASVQLVLGYCRAAGLDPMQKPVHIVPMWDSKAREMRDVIMPGIGLYRTQAARTGQCAGITEPEFGPDVEGSVGNAAIIYPAWCKVTVKRRLPDGTIAEFTAVERWLENYAVKGGQEKSTAPNAMWTKRPYGQIAKCAEAQALRKAFPEIASAPTADEMEGKAIDANTIEGSATEIMFDPWTDELRAAAKIAAEGGLDTYQTWWKAQGREFCDVAATTKTHADMKVKATEAATKQAEPAHVDD